MCRCIEEHGGDIVHFAGDAIIVMWPLGRAPMTPDSSEAAAAGAAAAAPPSLQAAAARQAARCALSLMEVMGCYDYSLFYKGYWLTVKAIGAIR